MFPMTEELRTLLTRQAGETKALAHARGAVIPYVFHRDGKPITSFYTAWRQACERAGCPGRIPHDLRRSAVRNLVAAGVSERTAMQMTGHKTRAIFDRYHIVSPGDLRRAGDLLDARVRQRGT